MTERDISLVDFCNDVMMTEVTECYWYWGGVCVAEMCVCEYKSVEECVAENGEDLF